MRAKWLIWIFSIVVFTVVTVLGRVKLDVDLGFDTHIFAKVNAVINSIVSVLLIAGLIAIRRGRQLLHKRIMYAAMILSILFLVSYICHHLLSGETRFGGTGAAKTIYYIILMTHIPLAGIMLPFILFTAYRAMIADYPAHRKLAKITWPFWLYVSVTGVVVYLMISPYYS